MRSRLASLFESCGRILPGRLLAPVLFYNNMLGLWGEIPEGDIASTWTTRFTDKQ
jgi:hypothetical protein